MQRQTEILSLVSQKKRVTVTELSAVLKVSEVTIRKDLTQLENDGLLRREHGYATIKNSDDISTRLLFNYDVKRRIAQKALESISDSETIMIESGSCCALLADEIVSNRRGTTVITNSVFVASFIRKKHGAHVILLGGDFQNESQVMVGPLVRQCAENFHVNKFFLGTDGFNERGAMSDNLMRAEAVRDMRRCAEQAIILTESIKFSQIGVVPLLAYNDIDIIYTDSQITASAAQKILAESIQIIQAS